METIVKAPLLYTSITKLTLTRFMDCLCDKEYHALIIAGEPSEVELIEAWAGIVEQYNDASGSTKQGLLIQRSAKLHRLQIKYNQTGTLITALKLYYVEAFAKKLNKLLNTNYSFDYRDWKGYQELLNKCNNRRKGILLDIELVESGIAVLSEKENGEAKEPTREDFQKTLITLSDHAGRELDENTLTVFSYCERLKRYNKYVELQHQEHLDKRRA